MAWYIVQINGREIARLGRGVDAEAFASRIARREGEVVKLFGWNANECAYVFIRAW